MNKILIMCAVYMIQAFATWEITGPGDGYSRSVVIENFDDGDVQLISYPGEDFDTSAWVLDTENTYNNSAYSLKLYGNTWKIEAINAVDLDTETVWQVSAYIETLGEIQGFGVLDSAHALLYAFSGTELLNPDDWVFVYQGAFPLGSWNIYKLPIGEDWLARFGYLPVITGIAFINDQDINSGAVAYFDEILDITEDLPFVPQVQIGYTLGKTYQNLMGTRYVDVQFYSVVVDSDSYYHEYSWYFGDDSTSNEPDPLHTYVVADDHPYTVLLDVVDSTGLHGRATCQVQVDSGSTTFPVTMNFVGDVMIARRYEDPGGVIDTLGVEGIFEPTLPYLGNSADITVLNLECPFTTQGSPHPTKPIVFRGKPEYIKGLVYAGVDVVSVANNHAIDYGLEGLKETQDSLLANNILYSGAGANSYEAYQPVFLAKAGVNIAFLASCNRTDQYDNYQPFLNAGYNKPGFAELTAYQLSRQIHAVEADADLKVVEMHSGTEYSLLPPLVGENDRYDDEFFSPYYRIPTRDDIELRHQAVDEGADLVINHHPHILQGFEVYNRKLIAHSLGNFVFDQNYSETFPSVILNTKIDFLQFYDYSIVPSYIDDYIPRRAKGELGLHILDYLARRSKELNTYVLIDRDSVLARIILDTCDLRSWTAAVTAGFSLKEDSGYWVSPPMRLADPGAISSVTGLLPSNHWQFRLGREVVWFGNFEDEGSTMWLLNDLDEFYDTISYQGARSLCQRRAVGNGAISTNFEKRLLCYSDSTGYSLYGHMKLGHSWNACIVAEFYASRTLPTVIGLCALDTVSGTDDWRFYHKEFTPTRGTKFFDICLTSAGPLSGGQGMTWFDNAGIIEWTEWQGGSLPISICAPNDFYWIQVRTKEEISNATLVYDETFYNSEFAEKELTDSRAVNDFVLSLPGVCKTKMKIAYFTSEQMVVSLKIYNILGQEIKTLVNGIKAKGQNTVVWDGRDDQGRGLSSGVYFCRLHTEKNEESKKFIFLK